MIYFKQLNSLPSEGFYTASINENLRIEKEDRQAYQQFCELRISPRIVGIVGFILSVITTYMYLMSLANPKSCVFLSILVSFALLLGFPMAIFLVYYRYNVNSKNPSYFLLSIRKWFLFVLNTAAVLGPLLLGLFLIARILNGRCESLDQLHMWSCNSEYDSHALPQEIVLSLMILPLIFSNTLKAISSTFIYASWSISVLFLIIGIILAEATQSIPILVAYIPLSLVTLYENNRQNVILFLVVKKQQMLLEANKKLSVESQNELRFMIANMAHDLKTVSVVLSMFID